MFPTASYANVESLIMWLFASTVRLSGALLHCALETVFKLANASGVKFWPQQSTPDVACVVAEEMRFKGSYEKFWVRPGSALLVTLVTVPLSPPERL